MYQVKYIETLGTGLTDLLAECNAKGLKKPLFEEVSGRFRVVIWRNGKTRRNRNESAIFEKLVLAYLREVDVEGAKLSDLQQLMPGLSRGHCQSVLRKLRKIGKIRSEGATSSARWFVAQV